jgi:V/A-type H+-transporting ATPase subunit C
MKKEFIYANGRVSGEEMTILSTRMWQMLVSARDLEETLRLLTDTWYGRFMQGHELGDCFERAMESSEQELLELSEDPRLIRGILHRRDVRNARYIWKSIIAGKGQPIELEREGLIGTGALSAAVGDDEVRSELPALFREALEELLELDNPNVRRIDFVMDELAARVELEELPAMSTAFEKYVRTGIEQKNFLIAGRCRQENLPRAAVEDLLMEGGFHSPEEIADSYQAGQLPALLTENQGLEKLSPCLEEALTKGSFFEYERESDRIMLEMLDAGSFSIFGPAPLAAFVMKREMEISHLRLLVAAKAARIDRNRLLRRLPRG